MATAPQTGRSMQIGEVAERTELSLRTLRHYDEIGLLRPSDRSAGGFRLYTEADLEKLLLIRRMKPLGFSLEEMLEVLQLIESLHTEPGDGNDRKLVEILADAQARRQKLQHQLAMADEFIELLTAEMR